jgi:HNH endonuclease
MQEDWRIVPSVPDISASSFGRILVAPSYRAMPNGGMRKYSPKPSFGYEEKSATGRPEISKRRIIRVGRLKKTFKIAQLVCEAFHGPRPFPKAVTIHLDEDPSNNVPGNLKWGTQKENLNMPKYKEWQTTIRVGANAPTAIAKARNNLAKTKETP